MQFEYPEDRIYFAKLLTEGDVNKLEKECAGLFDFRDPKIKRSEFNKTKKDITQKLLEKYQYKCQLNIHHDCRIESGFDIDHIIPLSTNKLNKAIRHMRRTALYKVPAQSFGSNHVSNLTIACKRCNAFKKHKILTKDLLLKLLED